MKTSVTLSRLALLAFLTTDCSRPPRPSNLAAAPAPAPVTERVAPIDPSEYGETDGPFATLAAYCAWFSRDCVPGDARLCACDPATHDSTTAVVAVRDLGQGDDATFWRPALRTGSGWRIARDGVDAHGVAETSRGSFRSHVALEQVSTRSSPETPIATTTFTLSRQEERFSRSDEEGWIAMDRSLSTIVCITPSDVVRCSHVRPLDDASVPAR